MESPWQLSAVWVAVVLGPLHGAQFMDSLGIYIIYLGLSRSGSHPLKASTAS